METEFKFLRELETDLTEVARAEQRRMSSPAKPRRRRTYLRAGIGAAAAVLALAFGVGILAESTGVRSPGGQSLIGVGQETPVPGAPAAPPTTSGRSNDFTAFGPDAQGSDVNDAATHGADEPRISPRSSGTARSP